MKNQRFGIEIELTGLTREAAAKAVAAFFEEESQYVGGSYDAYKVKDLKDRQWRIMKDASIDPQKKEKGEIVPAEQTYKVELVSPILIYEDIEMLQELVRTLRKAGAFANKSCGIHYLK